MIQLITNYSRAKRLLKVDDLRLKKAHDRKVRCDAIKAEVLGLSKTTIAYLKKISEIDVNSNKVNPISLYRELNRIKLSLYYSDAHTLYTEVFDLIPRPVYDTVFLYISESKIQEKSLEELESKDKLLKYSNIINNNKRDIDSLKKIVSIIDSYSD